MKYRLKTLISRPTDKKLDNLWSEAVKLRAGNICEYPDCRKKENLNAHHLYSRSRKSVRWDIDNGICLCAGHHSLNNNSAHKSPEFKTILIENKIRDEKFWKKLELKAKSPAKVDKNLEKLQLKNI